MADRWYRFRLGISNTFSRDRSEGFKVRLDIVVGLVTIVSLIFGNWLQWRENGDLDTRIAALNEENAELRTTVDENGGTIDALKNLNSELTRRNIELERDQPMPPDDLNAPPLRNNTSSLILVDDGIDLNTPNDPGFGMSSELGGGPDDLAYFGSGTLSFGGVAIARVEAGESARHATCAVAQGFESGIYELDVNEIDDRTCFRLNSGRFATIMVISSSSRQVELAIRVWELP